MLAPTQIKKPENWQDFESLCKILWGEIWNCPTSIKKNGRSGQKQCGVDVYAMPDGESGYYGIQCKGKDDYTDTQLTEKEIDTEIEKALNFKPALVNLLFATTANKDAEIEEYIRIKNVDHIQRGLFRIDIVSWEDIVDLLKRYRIAYNWYMNNCQYIDAANVEISFNGKQECTINPQYIRTTKTTALKARSPFADCLSANNINEILKKYPPSNIAMPFYGNSKRDYRWQRVYIQIKNTGKVTIDDYKLYLHMDTRMLILDPLYHYNNEPLIPDAIKAQINSQIDRERDVFQFSDGILIEPNKPLLLEDSAYFKFSIRADDYVERIPIVWHFTSRDFVKKGQLLINVVKSYIDKIQTATVYDSSEMREAEIIITPRIE